jgi:hypothetical protein
MMQGHAKGSQDFELNLAPVIDCFTVLITYLLVTASFISLAVLDAGVAARTPIAASEAAILPFNVEIVLCDNGDVAFRITGAPIPNPPLPVRPRGDKKWDMVGTARKMENLMRQFARLQEVTISAEPTVPYRELVRSVEVLRKFVPKVYLAG